MVRAADRAPCVATWRAATSAAVLLATRAIRALVAGTRTSAHTQPAASALYARTSPAVTAVYAHQVSKATLTCSVSVSLYRQRQ